MKMFMTYLLEKINHKTVQVDIYFKSVYMCKKNSRSLYMKR